MGTPSSALNPVVSEFAQSYNSFSGSDIRVVIGSIEFAELQSISYTVHREKAPIYCMGSPDPRAFSRNKRGIVGSLSWVTFDRHALLSLIAEQGGTFMANVDDVRPEYLPSGTGYVGATAIYDSTAVRGNGIPAGATVDQSTTTSPSVLGTKVASTPWYSDQIPPFDVTIMAANELGGAMAGKIYGVEILNEGLGIGIDDAVTEMQATFVARLVEPLCAVSPNTVGATTTTSSPMTLLS